jgi:hypothetical protein
MRRTVPAENCEADCEAAELGQTRCIDNHDYECIRKAGVNPPQYKWLKFPCTIPGMIISQGKVQDSSKIEFRYDIYRTFCRVDPVTGLGRCERHVLGSVKNVVRP